MVKSTSHDFIRSKDAKKLINDIKIEYMKKGMPPPSSNNILKGIIKKYNIKKEDVLSDLFIRF